MRPGLSGPDIIYVATPDEVGRAMLRAAGTTAHDVVYDLGSGDGRLVIAAAREFGARAVGVEIEARLVQDSREAAARAGITGRTRFLWQDLFATDISEATVVTLYLRDDVNRRLRPKLLAELAPGTRVVSHDFDMGEWRADRSFTVRGLGRDHRVLLWVVPARVDGAWRDGDVEIELRQPFQRLDGQLTRAGVAVALDEGRVAGVAVTFRAGALRFTGRVDADAIRGEAVGNGMTRRWTLTRRRR